MGYAIEEYIMPQRKPRTNGVERAFQVIEHLVETGEAATAYQVAKATGAPLSTIYDIIGQLEKLEVLQRNGGGGKFFLGNRMLYYGLAYTNHLAEDDVYRLEADNLCRTSGENVQICIRDGDYMVVAAMAEGGDHFYVSSRPGNRTPLNWSASGLLLIGHLSPEERERIFARAKPSPTGRALTDPDELEKACRDSWSQGYCIQVAQSDFAIANIAAPVINSRAECVATISLVVPEVVARSRGGDLLRHVLTSARSIERQLGYKYDMGDRQLPA